MKLRFAFLLLALALFSAGVQAQNCIYVNNDVDGPNRISIYQTDENGIPTLTPSSPVMTGGFGSTGGFFSTERIITVGAFLYAVNEGNNTVSAFSIDPATCDLTPVEGSPFPTGGVAGNGTGLAATPNPHCMYATHGLSNNVRVWSRDTKTGGLTPVGGLVALGGDAPIGSEVSPNGQWLLVALAGTGPHGSTAVFSIDSKTCDISPVLGSPFEARPAGGPDGVATGVEINCAGDTLFTCEANLGATQCNVKSIGEDGSLAPVKGSPFIGPGSNSNVAVLNHPADNTLVVSNQASNTVTVFGWDGASLTVVEGSPFGAGPGDFPSGMALDKTSTFLYGAKFNPSATFGFSVGEGGALTTLEGSPYPTMQALGSLSLALYPPNNCTSK